MPFSSARNCSSFSICSRRDAGSTCQAAQRRHAIRVDTDVPEAGRRGGARRVAVPGNRCARKYSARPFTSQATFTLFGSARSLAWSMRERERRDIGTRMAGEQLGHLVDDGRRNQRLIALHVHDDIGRRPSRAPSPPRRSGRCPTRACATSATTSAPKPRAALAMRSSSVAMMTSAAREPCARSCTHCSMVLAGQRQQHLAGQPRRVETGGNDDTEAHQRSSSGSSWASWRASSSSIIGTPSRIGNASRSARQTSTAASR